MSRIEELDRQIADLMAKKKSLLDEERKGALAEARKIIQTFGFSARELGLSAGAAPAASKGKKERGPATFRDPATGDEWDGALNRQGRKPAWIMAKINDGTIEKYRV
jgi:DNA-binding protein H-NS